MQHPKNPLRRAVLGAVAGAALLAVAPAALAQAWPRKPIRLVVAAGGRQLRHRRAHPRRWPDAAARPDRDRRQKPAGWRSAPRTLSAPRDGYTFLIAPNGLVSEMPHIAKPRFDPFKDIKPMAELSRSGLVMVGNAALPASNLKEVSPT